MKGHRFAVHLICGDLDVDVLHLSAKCSQWLLLSTLQPGKCTNALHKIVEHSDDQKRQLRTQDLRLSKYR